MTRTSELRWAVAYAGVGLFMLLLAVSELLLHLRLWPLAVINLILSAVYAVSACGCYRRARTL